MRAIYTISVLAAYLAFFFAFDSVKSAVIDNTSPVNNFFNFESLYECINLYLLTGDFSVFRWSMSERIQDERLKLLSESITPDNLQTIEELFQACHDKDKSALDVEEILKSEYFLEEFKDFIPSSGYFEGFTFAWTALYSSRSGESDEMIRDKLEVLLKNKFSLSLPPLKAVGLSPLNYAIRKKMVRCVELLVQWEDPNTSIFDSSSGYTPLLNACFTGEREIIEILSKAGADPSLLPQDTHDKHPTNIPTDFSFDRFMVEEALNLSSQFGFYRYTELLLANAKDIPTGIVGRAMIEASKNGHIECLKLLLLRSRNDISEDDVGWALQQASCFNHTDCVAYLFEKRDISVETSGMALVSASRHGHPDCMLLILKQRRIRRALFVDSAPEAYQYALKNGHLNCIKVLLEQVKRVSSSLAGEALYSACNNQFKEFVELLLGERRDIFRNDCSKALALASLKGHTECMKVILEKRPDIPLNAIEFALYTATYDNKIEAVKLLLDAIEGISIDSEYFNLALELATENKFEECEDLLMEKSITEWELEDMKNNDVDAYACADDDDNGNDCKCSLLGNFTLFC